MKLIIVSGPPSVGKTSVLLHTIRGLSPAKKKLAVIKLDCLSADDHEQYRRNGIESHLGLSTYICPDHFFSTNIERITKYGMQKKLEYMIVESAGLCNRCSPHLRNTLGVTVLDMLSGIHAPKKVGPMLKAADIIVATRGDLISQAEREVFRNSVAGLNRRALIIEINGLTGQNSALLSRQFKEAVDFDPASPLHLKYPMPGAVCSFCLGEKRAGESFASGNVKIMDLPGYRVNGGKRL